MSNSRAKKSRAQRSAAQPRSRQHPATPPSPPQAGPKKVPSVSGHHAPASADRRHARREAAIRKQKQQQQVRILIAVVAFAVLIGATLIFANRPSSTARNVDYDGIPVAQAPIAVAAGAPSSEGPTRLVGTTVGDPNAPVTFIVYFDFQCHFCQQFAVETYPQIVDDFVRSGQVKIELREFVALGGPDYADTGNGSARAAHGAMCAAEQGAYVEYHEVLFANFSADGATYTPDRLRDYADEAGLDGDRFEECMESNRYIPVLQQSKAEGEALGISATPMFVIDNGNGHPTVTQMTTSGYDLLRKQIEAAIETAE